MLLLKLRIVDICAEFYSNLKIFQILAEIVQHIATYIENYTNIYF